MADVLERLSDYLEEAHTNFIAAYRLLALAAPDGETAEVDGCSLAITGVREAEFNRAFVMNRPADAPALLKTLLERFAGRDLPWMLVAGPAAATAVAIAARGAGLRVGPTAPVMMLAPLRGEPPAVEGLAIDVVDGPALGEIFAAIHAGGFGIPKELAALFVAPGIRDTPGLTHYVGWLHGRPAATASRVTTGRVAGLYNIATAAEFRGRGIATAITWQAALDGIAEGCEVSVLQASAMGYRVYQAMGFQQVADYRSWYWLGRA